MTLERLEHSQIKASFEVSPEEFDKALDEAFKICNEKVTIKGFRKGHASKEVYLKHYGVESLYADAIDAAVSAKMRDELIGKAEIASQPVLDLDYKEVKEHQGFKFTLTFDTLPEVTLGQYKGIEVEALSNVPTDEEIANEEERLLKSKITTEEKDGKILEGDTVNFDFVGSVDGVEFEGGSAKDFKLKVGSHQFIPGFEEQMVGMEKGSEGDIKVTFPTEYGQKDLAGKEANFHLTIHSIEREVKPELTDSLVCELKIDNVKTVEEFKAHLVDTLTERKTNYNNQTMERTCIERVVAAAEVDLPLNMVNQRAEELKENAKNQAKMYNIPFETFLQFSGVTVEQFNEQALQEAKNQTKTEFVLDKIAATEKLVPADDEVMGAINSYATSVKRSVKEVLKRVGKEPFIANLAANKAIRFVVDNKIVK